MVTTTFCLSGAALKKAGINVSAALSAGSILQGSDFIVDLWIVEAESYINVATRYNYTDNYATLNADGKDVLHDTASSLAGMNCISYELKSYYSNEQAQVSLDFLRDRVQQNIEILKDKNAQFFITGA